MGQWESKRGHVSDTMADILDGAFKEIGQLESSQVGMIDLADAIEFCSFGIFKVEMHKKAEDMRHMKVCDLGKPDSKAIPNRGQIHSCNVRVVLLNLAR